MRNIEANGARFPALGFGTYRMTEAEVATILPAALKTGFRHIDTAQAYENEAAVGQALRCVGVPRREIFLTTKVWPIYFAPADFQLSVEESLRRLQTDYVDLLLLHWPNGSEVPREVQIRELNSVRTKGLARHIGVSNYSTAQMEEANLLSEAPLVTNQVEYHPWLSQDPVLATARKLGISVTAYYPMAEGRSARDPLLTQIGAAYGKSAAQVALRWVIQQHGTAVLSRTTKLHRIRENFAIFDFALREDEMALIAGLAAPEGRLVSPPDLAPIWD